MKNKHHIKFSLVAALGIIAALYSCRKNVDVTEPHKPVTKTDYVHLVLNGEGQEEIVFCELVPQANVTIRSSASWLKLTDSGRIVELETLDLGALKEQMTEQSLSAKKGQRKVLLLEYDGFDIANGSEPRSADITIDTDLGDHLVMQVIQGENIYEYTYDFFDPHVITAQGLGGPFQYGSTDVVGGLKPTPYNGNQDFTRETWRDEEYIMIYTKKGDEEDFKGKKGYEIIPLPWNHDFTVSNMPVEIVEETNPEEGWELVMNMCGFNLLANVNYFAVYNRYLGTLRVFVYTPELNVANANDQMWQVLISNNLAERIFQGIGKPYNLSDVSKFNAVMGQTLSKEFSQLVSPWTRTYSSDGYITPNEGWWAMDIDLSEMRSTPLVPQDNMLTFQVRAWANTHVTLTSSIQAQIDGTLAADIDLQSRQQKFINSSAGGMSGLVSALLGGGFEQASGLTDLVKTIFGAASTPVTPMGALATLGAFGFSVKNWLNGKPGETYKINGGLNGSINLGLNGTIDTQGLTTQSTAVSGIPSPTINFGTYFDTQNSTVGQGVWALEDTPQVWFADYLGVYKQIEIGGAPLPLEGILEMDVYCEDGVRGRKPFAHAPSIAYGLITCLDPESIKVVVNRNVFPNPESINVQAYLVSADNQGVFGSTAALREALQNKNEYTPDAITVNTDAEWKDASGYNEGRLLKAGWQSCIYKYPAPMDGDLGWHCEAADDDRSGKLKVTLPDGKFVSLNGYYLSSGGESFRMIDPLVCGQSHPTLHSVYFPWVIPDLAVVVCLEIKQDGDTFYYCRPYLPDIVGHQICNPADYADAAKREVNLKRWEDLASKGSEDGITLSNRRALYYKIYRAAGGLKPFADFAAE